ncbi:MAG TPA: beta-ketoacyl synthase chain length factor [Rhodanobacteraceae bacterium]|nr:beta-ketoacyl synthase chain length factor [Rhodanobacteraceae bacterium]
MDALIVYVDGIGFWAPGIADWPSFERALERDDYVVPETTARPSPAALPPTERRRAPEPVLIASEAAGQACAMAARDASTLASVFTSTHGDLAITDAMCATLAADPRELSPTRFHNSVHNAPAGYWTVAAHCHAPATAISAERGSFAAGLFEAALEVAAEGESVLLGAYDIAAHGPLAEVAPSALPFATAFVLSATHSERSIARLSLRTTSLATTDATPSSLAPLRGNPMGAQALPLLVALARREPATIVIASGAGTALAVEVTP